MGNIAKEYLMQARIEEQMMQVFNTTYGVSIHKCRPESYQYNLDNFFLKRYEVCKRYFETPKIQEEEKKILIDMFLKLNAQLCEHLNIIVTHEES